MRCLFACSVRTDETKDAAGSHLQTEIADGGKPAKALGDALQNQCRFRLFHFSACYACNVSAVSDSTSEPIVNSKAREDRPRFDRHRPQRIREEHHSG